MKLKNVLFLMSVMLVIVLPSFSQTKSIFPLNENGEIVYSGIINIDSVNSKELYGRANEWFVNIFKSAKDVIQLNDKEAGKIIGKGNFNAGIAHCRAGMIHQPIYGVVNFTVEIQTKDGKYKYNFSNFQFKYLNTITGEDVDTDLTLSSFMFLKNKNWQTKWDMDWVDIKQDINTKMLNIIAELKKVMNTNKNSW